MNSGVKCFYKEIRNFICFIKKPSYPLKLQTKLYSNHIEIDCCLQNDFRLLLSWLSVLWLLNIFILGPCSYVVASYIEAYHRMQIHSISILTVVIWAPLVEEILFRYSLLCSFSEIIIIIPFFILLIFSGPSFFNVFILFLLIIVIIYLNEKNSFSYKSDFLNKYIYFPFLFYFSSFLFAFIHLLNFCFENTSNFLMVPFLVLPQFVTGLVLGWIRVSRGIVFSIILHSLFNAGLALLICMQSEKIYV
ncbi:hypothetical protein CDSE_0319 [Candidatus Kinetoplastibacterium desouzaii TCC079E]|uniref:CAAX prenyl protease 2/Lysostaphin resistance protein A-like domain-containing protein n=1 Tax=Candidatus Kinetoplastidibacterium desouzai TCC079E TaxID=1208919 RepID=M1LTL9_9PROT|nr:CPBP family glutamic-type intramembrane protease [Candidatus Kinetoplastibacterium desouzaii]AGF46659.1 hypothetical protein CDSE_0319 [Candidatus Kinetoplastibacterium desouzaii TCC079E]